jgi:hypothetical protein
MMDGQSAVGNTRGTTILLTNYLTAARCHAVLRRTAGVGVWA